MYGEAIALIRPRKTGGGGSASSMTSGPEDGIVISAQDTARLHYNRARAAFQLDRKAYTAAECEKALDLISDYTNALALRGECRLALFEYKQAASDLERLVESDPGNDSWRQMLREARRQRDMTHYQVLGITQDADEAAIKKAYRKQSVKWHPDKHQSTEDSIVRANTMFKVRSSKFEGDRRDPSPWDRRAAILRRCCHCC